MVLFVLMQWSSDQTLTPPFACPSSKLVKTGQARPGRETKNLNVCILKENSALLSWKVSLTGKKTTFLSSLIQFQHSFWAWWCSSGENVLSLYAFWPKSDQFSICEPNQFVSLAAGLVWAGAGGLRLTASVWTLLNWFLGRAVMERSLMEHFGVEILT